MRNLLRGGAAIAVSVLASTAWADAPGSMIHGFASVQASNDYITPRGLLVTDRGVTVQALAGLVMVLPADFSLVAGVWNDLDSFTQSTKPGAGAWQEEDFFAGINYQATKQLKLSLTYDIWTFPGGPPPDTEQNLEFTAAYDDGSPGAAFSWQPHATIFWAVTSPSSVVTLGRPANDGTTAYLELGLTPTYAFKSVPVTLTMPSWFSVGPSEFWCDQSPTGLNALVVVPTKGRGCSGSNFGVFSTGLTATTPLSFIPKAYGSWRAYAGFQYFNLLNGALVDAQLLTIGNGEGHRNVVNAFAGIGVGF
jgi:hypothetical protein